MFIYVSNWGMINTFSNLTVNIGGLVRIISYRGYTKFYAGNDRHDHG